MGSWRQIENHGTAHAGIAELQESRMGQDYQGR